MTTDWKEYTGSDEQIAEMQNAEEGYVLRYKSGVETCHILTSYKGTFGDVKSYWIIPSDPLRGMKVRQAQTGQPVWYKHKIIKASGQCNSFHMPFIQPETYEYSFTPFEEEV